MNFILIRDCLIIFILSILFIYYLKKILYKYKFLDYVNNRSSHSITKIRGGGISFLIIGSFYFLIKGFYYPLLCNFYSILGFIDDKFIISFKKRLLFQLIFSTFICYKSKFYILLIDSLDQYINQYIILFLLIIFITGLINFINFMDGIDGIICASIIPWLISLSIITSTNIYFAFSFIVIAFLIWNWQPAKIFMGDVGSMYLGSFIAISLLQGDSYINFFALIMIISPLLIDPFICLVTRLLYGHNIFSPHRLHLYQRLVQNGLNHWEVSTIYSITVMILSFTYFIFGMKILITETISLFIVFTFLSLKQKRFFKQYY